MSKKGILLVGHGSKLPLNKELVEETAGLIARRYPDFIVKCGFMNMNSPSIQDSMNEFRKEPIDVLVVDPLFLPKGFISCRISRKSSVFRRVRPGDSLR